MRPLVSIGLPIYNGMDYLEHSVNSILGQSFEDFELVISDNASTDGTSEYCKELASKDRRIVYYRNKENIGASANYNRTFHLSKGKYFKWSAHDDVCHPELLKRCLEVLKNSSDDTVLCFPQTVLINELGETTSIYKLDVELQEPLPDQRFIILLRNLKKCNSIHGLIKSSVLRSTRLFGNYFASDVILLAELALLGKFVHVAEPLFMRRMHPKSSRRINKSYEDVSVWFDPKNKGKIILPVCRLTSELIRCVNKAPIPAYLKIGCYLSILEDWGGRYWRVMGGEAKMGYKQLASRLPNSEFANNLLDTVSQAFSFMARDNRSYLKNPS